MSPRYHRDPDFAPERGTPLRGWRGLGAAMLDQQLWPEDHRFNPLMVYFTGKRTGWLGDDVLGVMPWIGAIIVSATAFYQLRVSGFPGLFFPLVLGLIIVAPVLAFAVSSFAVTHHLRGLVRRLPIEEIALTGLSPREIVHGVGIRPFSVQSFSITIVLIAQLMIITIFWRLEAVSVSALEWFLAVTYTVIGAYITSCSAELSGAITLRAHMYIRSRPMATARVCREWIGGKIFFPLILCFTLAAVVMLVSPLICLFLLVAIGEYTRSQTNKLEPVIMHDCHRAHEWWWFLRQDEEDAPFDQLFKKPWGQILGDWIAESRVRASSASSSAAELSR